MSKTTATSTALITNSLLLGTVTVPGTDPTQNATWTFQSPTADILNLPQVSATQDGERTLFAQDSLDDPASYAYLNLYLDTIGPQVSSVTFGTGQDVFLSVPNGPTPSNNSIDITFTDNDIRTADFPSFSALNNTLAQEIGNYNLTGAAGGNIPITSVTYSDLTQVGGPGVTEMQLNFASPLKDDIYTLSISDNLESDPGNALDGLVTQTPGGTDTIALPSGNGTPGSGSFVASFAVQGGLNLGVQLTQGFQSTDLQGASGAITTAIPFYKPSDTVFSGNFQDPSSGPCRRIQQAGRLRHERRPVSLPFPERCQPPGLHTDHFRCDFAARPFPSRPVCRWPVTSTATRPTAMKWEFSPARRGTSTASICSRPVRFRLTLRRVPTRELRPSSRR